jgi:hypothetical protein
MKPLVLTLLLSVAAFASGPASAQNAGDYFQPKLTTKPNCATLRVKWAPSPFPTAPYPSMNILRVGLENSSGKLIVVNLEMETSHFSYQGSRACPLLITLPPTMTVGQGFYGPVARLSGFKTPGYTNYGIRTAGHNPNVAALIASGPNVPDKTVTLGDMCTGSEPTCEIILRANLMWFEP